MWTFVRRAALVLLLLSPVRCDSEPADSADGDLEGGILATFRVEDEVFRVWITKAQTVQQVLDLRDGTGTATIPNGPLLSGPGKGDHNKPWSWHLHPEETEMAEITVEVCDGLPSFVETDLDYWINDVGRYCPWSATLVDVEDFR